MDTVNTRRVFFKQTACIVAGLAAANMFTPAWATNRTLTYSVNRISLQDNESLTPLQMAEQSNLIKQSWQYLHEQIETIKDTNIKKLIQTIYNNPEPLVGKRLSSTQRQELWQALAAKQFTQASVDNFLPPIPNQPLSFYTAPGSGYASHHAYPGGLITHVAANVSITNSIVDTYKNVYGYDVDRDIALAAQLLHDLHKPWVFQWAADNSYRTEQTLAGTGEHHILTTAELIYRKAPAKLVIATVCAHQAPVTEKDEKEIAQWVEAAAMIAGVDPVQYGLLTAEHKLLPFVPQEGYICHLGDHDYVLSVPAVKLTLPIIQELAKQEFNLSDADLKSKKFYSLRNKFYSTYSAMYIHEVMATEGKIGVTKLLNQLFVA